MTAPRDEIWANERRTAELCGHTYAWFCQHRQELEAKGFPKRHALIGKRPVHSILEFLGLGNRGETINEPDNQPAARNWG